jgi:hypothetical protein
VGGIIPESWAASSGIGTQACGGDRLRRSGSSCAAPSRMNLPVQFSTKFELVINLKSIDVPIKL